MRGRGFEVVRTRLGSGLNLVRLWAGPDDARSIRRFASTVTTERSGAALIA